MYSVSYTTLLWLSPNTRTARFFTRSPSARRRTASSLCPEFVCSFLTSRLWDKRRSEWRSQHRTITTSYEPHAREQKQPEERKCLEASSGRSRGGVSKVAMRNSREDSKRHGNKEQTNTEIVHLTSGLLVNCVNAFFFSLSSCSFPRVALEAVKVSVFSGNLVSWLFLALRTCVPPAQVYVQGEIHLDSAGGELDRCHSHGT